MDHQSSRRRASVSPSHSPDRAAIKARLASLSRGFCCAAIAFLLEDSRLLFGAAPLGVAFLCASSRYTWYILGGLLLSALGAGSPSSVGLRIGVYAAAILLRLAALFFLERTTAPRSAASVPLRKRWKVELARYKQLLWGDPTVDEATDEDTPPEPTRHRRFFREAPLLRGLSGCVCGLLLGIGNAIAGGFAVYDLLAALFSLVCVPTAVGLLIPFFKEDGQALLFAPPAWNQGLARALRTGQISPMTAVSVVMVQIAAVYAANRFSLTLGSPYLIIAAAPLLALLLSLRAASRMGFVPGVVLALLLGICVDPLISPAYLLAVMIFVPLRLLSLRLGTVAGTVAALCFCAMTGGTAGLARYFLTFLLAIPVFLLLEHLHGRHPHGQGSTETPSSAELSRGAARAAAQRRQAAQRQRLCALSDALSSLSGLFYDMSTRLRHPRATDIQRMCETIVASHCAGCQHRAVCRYGSKDGAHELASHMSVQLRAKGSADVHALPSDLGAVCSHGEPLCQEINRGYGELTEQYLRSEKTEVFADDYKAMAAILEDTLQDPLPEEDLPSEADARAIADIHSYLTGLGYDVSGVTVGGSREHHVTVQGAHMELASSRAEEIRHALSKICGVRFASPTFEVKDGMTVMHMVSVPDLHVSFSGSTVPAYATEGEILPPPLTHDTPTEAYVPPCVCGDHIALFANDHAYFYALISDGMGSGEEASVTSDISTVFLKRLLEAGSRPETSIAMLGNFLRQKNVGTGNECSATVDLMELDLFCGDAVFFKNGAAPTYVVRNNRVYKLRSRSLPIGILKDTRPELLRFRTHPGDVVVMVSDGVTHGNDECPWLIDMLSDPLPQSMDDLRADILSRAIASGSPDDLSAIAVRVEEAEAVRVERKTND